MKPRTIQLISLLVLLLPLLAAAETLSGRVVKITDGNTDIFPQNLWITLWVVPTLMLRNDDLIKLTIFYPMTEIAYISVSY
jgi:hypothetical protein